MTEPTGTTTGTNRVLRPAELELTRVERTDAHSSEGEIHSAALWLSADGTQKHGVWQMSPGVLEGITGPETVYILRGRATVTIAPAQERLTLIAGDFFVLQDGETARWDVHEEIRKIYVLNTHG